MNYLCLTSNSYALDKILQHPTSPDPNDEKPSFFYDITSGKRIPEEEVKKLAKKEHFFVPEATLQEKPISSHFPLGMSEEKLSKRVLGSVIRVVIANGRSQWSSQTHLFPENSTSFEDLLSFVKNLPQGKTYTIVTNSLAILGSVPAALVRVWNPKNQRLENWKGESNTFACNVGEAFMDLCGSAMISQNAVSFYKDLINEMESGKLRKTAKEDVEMCGETIVKYSLSKKLIVLTSK